MLEAASPLKTLSAAEFAVLGLEQFAYIKAVTLPDGKNAIGVFAADGRPLAGAPDIETAQALVRQNELEPALVH
ncbi:DUF1150 family protein [Reyranella sp. CPCC 100927]|uniref:DUF1150 family protein n=1 Tax=Reyranella sp. CPCC 100927 TaxID=2599616 RepID=UPI0011B4214C|nr:DUF1150 family protein [Reyranella sp. CPCC 100927]TWT15101.1 DUF1150 family protein [Reyranella sp. CPCC 100927]